MNAPQPSEAAPLPRETNPCHIGIVGGGTAGWMAAATLRRRLGCRVTVVQSDRSPGVGVGEATIPALIDWLANMQIDEDAFMRATGATYKLGIRFDNWIHRQHRYWHPFGSCGTIDHIDLVHFAARLREASGVDKSIRYEDFCLQRHLCEHNRAPRQLDGSLALENYAFHVDAGRLANFIAEIAIADGVVARTGHVSGAVRDDRGRIRWIDIAGQPPLTADLFVDCSGFSSVLLQQTMDQTWEDWGHWLLCDRAIVTHIDHQEDAEPELPPYTTSTGLHSGWAWKIPLTQSVGSGYVFSSQHASDDDAHRELACHLRDSGHDRVTSDSMSSRVVPMRVGVSRQSSIRNCVALGLSAGFIEPLESTGIHLVQRGLDELVACLPTDATSLRDSIERFDHASFNATMRRCHEEVRDFVMLHYVLSKRCDTPFWRDARNVDCPDSLTKSMQRYQSDGRVPMRSDSIFAEPNHHFIYTGGDCWPAQVTPPDDLTSPGWLTHSARCEDISKCLREIRLSHQQKSNRWPEHSETLSRIHSHTNRPHV